MRNFDFIWHLGYTCKHGTYEYVSVGAGHRITFSASCAPLRLAALQASNTMAAGYCPTDHGSCRASGMPTTSTVLASGAHARALIARSAGAWKVWLPRHLPAALIVLCGESLIMF